jgi:hypothetical protein
MIKVNSFMFMKFLSGAIRKGTAKNIFPVNKKTVVSFLIFVSIIKIKGVLNEKPVLNSTNSFLNLTFL